MMETNKIKLLTIIIIIIIIRQKLHWTTVI